MIPVFNQSYSRRRKVVAGGGTYRALILAYASLFAYYRNGAASGIVAADEAGAYPGTYLPNSGGAWTGGTLGATGAISGDADTAATFDGSSGYMAATVAAHTFAAITLEAWIKPIAYSGDQAILASADPGSSPGYLLRLTGNQLQFFPDTTNSLATSAALPGAADGQWAHVAATYSDAYGKARFYFNGAFVSEATPNGSGLGSRSDIYVGIYHLDRWWFNGGIDEAAVYTARLTDAELLANYNRGAFGT